MSFDPRPVTLEGRHVRLEPLGRQHAAGLFAASRPPEIWTYLSRAPFADQIDVEGWIDEAARAQEAGSEVPFATVRRSDGRIVGSTRFIDIRRPHRGLEIGWTWINPEAQRTAVNTEAKYLMLCHAFDAQGAMRVQLKSDERNQKSRRAMERIGAQFEGVLRQQMFRAHDGYVRSSAMYSILDKEWPAVKAALEAKLAK
jgi:RimJ/RimL family protein N-acetyltransferase